MNDMEIFLSSWKILFALCLVQKLKSSLVPSKQVLLYHANQVNLIVYVKYVEDTRYSQLLKYQTMGGFLTIKYFRWMRFLQ